MHLALALSLALAATQPDDDLVGLWGARVTFGPQVRGELLLERHGPAWTMRAGGYEVTAPAGEEIRIALPGDAGELRGHLEHAFWVQPRGNLGQFASPVTLQPNGPNAWRGVIRPLDDRFSLYLLIKRAEDGSLHGEFHNPEVNWTGGAPWFRVVRHEESIDLVDPTSGKTRLVQPYDPQQRKITMDFGSPFALEPVPPGQAVGFVPRAAAAGYRYRLPVARDDGWTTARAGDVGMDEESLGALVARIIATDPSGDAQPRIHSLLVARKGKLILEEYFYGFSEDRAHDLRSASKTFTSLMAGIAMAEHKSLRVDTPLINGKITLGHLLTHSSGLACDDNDDASPGNEGVMQSQQKQPDWFRYFLELPVVHEPGTTYAYCSAGINAAAGIVRQTTASWLPEFFDRTIAQPLRMGPYHINLMPNGEGYGGGGTYMRPRDFLKLGQLYLNGGTWNGRRVVSKEWVQTSTAHQIRTSGGGSDGYGWHRNTLHWNDRDYQEIEANGNGGQFVIVIPTLDLAIAFTAGNYNRYPVWRTFRDQLVPQYIIGAVAKPAALEDEIRHADQELFAAFNAHDLPGLQRFFSRDLEFFHDTGGLLTFAQTMQGFESNFVRNNGLRRDLVEGTLEVFPIANYGAIETGAHTFCHVEGGRNDCGTFKFVHVWRKRDGQWQITRVVSYGH